eukprot:15350265-Ditylum_brightwellii.AAC.2
MHGAFNYNHTPMAPPGTKVVIHEKPLQQNSWAPHGTNCLYLGPAINHYRCYHILVKHTGVERISDTVDFSPGNIKSQNIQQKMPQPMLHWI